MVICIQTPILRLQRSWPGFSATSQLLKVLLIIPVISILQCITKKYKNAMIMQFQTPKAAKPRGYGLCSPASTIQTRLHHRSSQTVLFKFYNFPADILSLLHILFWLTDSLLPICCHFIITALKLLCNRYFEYTASFLERRYTQYWFMLIPSLCECSANDRCRLRGILNLNCPE